MKIKRETLERIVYEEFIRYLGESLNEAPKAEMGTADELPPEEEEFPEDPVPDPENAPEEPTGMPELGDEPNEIPGGDEEADDELEKDVEGEDDDGPVEGGIADQVQGKTIQSISMDPKSKMMPGATEIVLTFSDIPDALRILVTQTGRVKFFFRGLHNDLGDVTGFQGDADMKPDADEMEMDPATGEMPVPGEEEMPPIDADGEPLPTPEMPDDEEEFDEIPLDDSDPTSSKR
jgi:hypothetical protein